MLRPREPTGHRPDSRRAAFFTAPPSLEFMPPSVARMLRVQLVVALIYVAGRVLLPLAGSGAVEVWRLAVGFPLYLLAAAICWRRSNAMQRDRVAWRCCSIAIVGFLIGSLSTKLFGSPSHAPVIAYVGWSAFYVGMYAGLAMLARSALMPFPWAYLLDAVAVVFALAAAASTVFDVVGSQGYSAPEALLVLAYPALDVLLLAFLAWIAGAGETRDGQAWRPVMWALGAMLIGDLTLLVYGLADGLSTTAPYTALYPVAMSCLAFAAWTTPPAPDTLRTANGSGFRIPIVLGAGGLVVIALSLSGVVGPIPGAMGVAALVVILARSRFVYRELVRGQGSRRFQQGFEDAGIGMALIDGTGRWLQVNTAMANLVGMRAEAMVGVRTLERVAPEHRSEVERLMQGLREGATRVNPFDLAIITPNGTRRDVLVAGDVISSHGDDFELFAQVQDVTTERLVRRFSAVTTMLSQRALVASNADVLMQEVSAEIQAALGCDVAAVVLASDRGDDARVLAQAGSLRPGLRTALSRADYPVAAALATGQRVDWHDLEPGEGVTADGLVDAELESFAVYPVVPAIGPPAAFCVGYTVARSWATPEERQLLESVATLIASALERTRREDQARHDALHDPLTGLANRVLLNAHVGHAVEASRRDNGQVGVILVDLDRFKNINDSLGHGAGDALLVQVAERLLGVTRGRDLVARLGGDEFVIAVDRVHSLAELEAFADRMVCGFREPFQVGERELYIEASLGIAVGTGGDATAETLLRDADVAMYRAKADGGSRFAMFDEELRAEVVARSDTEYGLRHAVARGELRIALQPQIHVDGVHPVSFESLVRWARPGAGVVPPSDFVQVAEDTGLIIPLGTWVLQESVEWAARAAARTGVPPVVSVNVSARQLTDDLPAIVSTALATSGLPPEYLCLELTESMLISSSRTDEIIARLRAIGVSLSLDDFGTGWSSLAALQRHPVDELKLDRSMVVALGVDEAAAAITRAAAQMALALNLRVVAEGIETVEQFDAVRQLGCQVVQGYLFSKPLWPEDAERYLDGGTWRALLERTTPAAV